MRLSKALEDKKLDVRLRDKLVHEGKLTKQDCESYLSSLPDDNSNATFIGKTEQAQASTNE